MTRSLLSLALLLGTAAPVWSAPATSQSPLFEARDLFSLEQASDPQISPDGSRIAYVRQSGDIMIDRMRPTIWLIETRTGEQMPLVAGQGAHTQPRWSPDGKRLAYISAVEGGSAQLFVRWMNSGESVRITGLPTAPSDIAWSPDGRQIAYAMFVPGDAPKLGSAPAKPEGAQWAAPLEIYNTVTFRSDGQGNLKPGFSHLFLVSADGGAPRRLTFGNFHNNGPVSWSTDGRTLLFSSNRSPNWERDRRNSEVYSLDVASGAIAPLTDRQGPDAAPKASPDGRLVAYTGFDDERFGHHDPILYVMNRDGSGRRALTQSLDRDINDHAWAADGRSLYVSYGEKGTRRIAKVGLDGSIRVVADGMSGGALDRPYSGGSFSVANDGSIAFTSGTPTRPADVALLKGGSIRRLTRLNSELLDNKRLGEVRKITTPSSFDQRPIDAWITLPPSYREGQRVPLILEIHGGPFQAYGPHFATDNQLFASAGYAVLSVNPRGSTSYGADFANLIHHAYPGHDYDDLISAVDAAIAQGFADPEQLFVTGGSGGGLLTAWIIGKTSRFKAAAVQKPVIDWPSLVLTTDNPAFAARHMFGKFPWEDPQAYWSRSPLSLVGNVKTPTLVLVGSDDLRTPPSQAEQYYTALQLLGVPTTYIKVPGAGHGLVARPSQSAARVSAILAWFERYKAGMPAAAAGTP